MATSDNYHTLLPMYKIVYRDCDLGGWAEAIWNAYKKKMNEKNEMTIEQKTKKTLSPEHLAKLKEGRRLARERKTLSLSQEKLTREFLNQISVPNINNLPITQREEHISDEMMVEELKIQEISPSSTITKKEAFEYMLQYYKTGDFSTDYATARIIFDYLSKD